MKFIMKFADERKKLKFHEICRYGQCVSFHMKFHTALWALRAQSADVSLSAIFTISITHSGFTFSLTRHRTHSNQPCVRCTAASVQPAVRLAVTRSPLQPRGAILVSTSILEPPLKTASFYPVFETAKTDLTVTRKEMLSF